MPPNRFESEVESFLEGSHGDRTHIKRAGHHTVTPLCGTLLLWALPSLAFLAVVTVAVVRLYGQAVDHGDPKSYIMPFLFLGTLWWNCLIHALYVVCVRRMNPSVGFHIGAAIAAFVASSVAAFVCVWMFVTAVNVGALPGS